MNQQTVVDFLRDRKSTKMPTIEEMASEMALQPKEITDLMALLGSLETSGVIIKTKKGRIALPEDMGFYTGILQLHAKGFGFLSRGKNPQGERLSDIFIPPDATLQAMNGDTVLVRLKEGENPAAIKVSGEVVKVLHRNTQTVIGVYTHGPSYGVVESEDKKMREAVYVVLEDSLHARNNDVVVCQILRYPTKNQEAQGRILSVLGQKGAPGVDILAILSKYGLSTEFPQKVLDCVEAIPEGIAPEELEKRRDLREEVIVTIDGADAKDLDDAVTVRRLQNGNYHLGVHIADVSHYVREGSPCDEEALHRATSVYLIDLVIPMLPKKLSNNLCSLNPYTDKLTLSCEMEIDGKGQVVHSDVFESVIRTTARMTYDDVNAMLMQGDPELKEKYHDLLPLFESMQELFHILNEKRMKRGALDFDFTESEIELNDKGEPMDVRPLQRGVSNRIIEEFMLAANETVAEQFHWQRIPFVYRIHDEPDPEKLEVFSEMANMMDVSMRIGKDVTPKDLQQVLEWVKGTPAEHVLSKLLLRSMMQARYSPVNTGHFGLAAKYYCHFTSPIRRYPDLEIHRIIKKTLNGSLTGGALDHAAQMAEKVSLIASDLEREAESAEREVEDLKKAEYMHAHLGEEYEGIISSVTPFGFFVELPNTIEGLVHINTLPADVIYDERRMILDSVHHGGFCLGDTVRIQVASVDLGSRDINFELLGLERTPGDERPERPSKAPLQVGTFGKREKDRKRERSRRGGGTSPFSGWGKGKAFQKNKKDRKTKKRGKTTV
ncbi:3'-to-5' exoribonuclease RNase R [Clostridiaceae bacterium JG1575]|nr:3'-to-5' exoribonuclease RNase R [Clostridiaceae bacterium JG1575]